MLLFFLTPCVPTTERRLWLVVLELFVVLGMSQMSASGPIRRPRQIHGLSSLFHRRENVRPFSPRAPPRDAPSGSAASAVGVLPVLPSIVLDGVRLPLNAETLARLSVRQYAFVRREMRAWERLCVEELRVIGAVASRRRVMVAMMMISIFLVLWNSWNRMRILAHFAITLAEVSLYLQRIQEAWEAGVDEWVVLQHLRALRRRLGVHRHSPTQRGGAVTISFSLEAYSRLYPYDRLAKGMFGFTFVQLEQLSLAMGLPEFFYIPSRQIRCRGSESLAMVLYYLRGNSEANTAEKFRRSESYVSSVWRAVALWVWQRFGGLVQHVPVQRLAPNGSHHRLEAMAANIARIVRERHPHTEGVHGVFGFVDGTKQQIERPGSWQSQMPFYHGKYHAWMVGWQFVMFDDGLVYVDGPFNGRDHDSSKWKSSRSAQDIRIMLEQLGARGQFFIYGDKGYPDQPAGILRSAIRERSLVLGCPEQLSINAMSSVRVTVEQGIGRVLQSFACPRLWHTNRITITLPALKFMLCCLFTNLKTVLAGRNQVTDFLHTAPPTLQEYLQVSHPFHDVPNDASISFTTEGPRELQNPGAPEDLMPESMAIADADE